MGETGLGHVCRSLSAGDKRVGALCCVWPSSYDEKCLLGTVEKTNLRRIDDGEAGFECRKGLMQTCA